MELMIEIDSISTLENLLKENLPQLSRLTRKLAELYRKHLQDRYPEKSLAVLRKEFTVKSELIK